MNQILRILFASLISSPTFAAAPKFLAAPERDGANIWVCFNATPNGVTYGAPVSYDLCFNGYKVEYDHRGNLWCYRKDAKENAYGPPLSDSSLCNQ